MQFTIRVKPGSRKGPLVEETPDAPEALTVYVRERAVDGAANTGVIHALATHFEVPPSRVDILRGHSGRIKRVEINE